MNLVHRADPVLNSRYLLYEAQQAPYYGLSSHLALAAVTSTPAETLGMEHRIGFLKPGQLSPSHLQFPRAAFSTPLIHLFFQATTLTSSSGTPIPSPLAQLLNKSTSTGYPKLLTHTYSITNLQLINVYLRRRILMKRRGRR